MLFAAPPPLDAEAPSDAFSTAGQTLTQLHHFFEHHTFDTAGPYSDLFSVLLSCCKHLVDASLLHHTTLAAQQREVTRLGVETEALCALLARGPDAIHGTPSPQTETTVSRLETLTERLEAVESQCRTALRGVEEVRRQREEWTRHADVPPEALQPLREEMRQLQRGVASHAAFVQSELAAMHVGEEEKEKEKEKAKGKGSVNGGRTPHDASHVVDQLRRYTDQRVEALREELCRAIQNAKEPNQTPNQTREAPNGSPDRCSLSHSLQHLLTQCPPRSPIPAQLAALESRLEVLEVYAPHRCAMAARPPLLGVELCDAKGIGVRVEGVFRGLPAAHAGLARGDVIIAVNGQEVLTRAEMYAVLTELVREHRARRRVLRDVYYEAHFGKETQRHTDGETEVRRWALPTLKLSLHLKRGGTLREVNLNAEVEDDEA